MDKEFMIDNLEIVVNEEEDFVQVSDKELNIYNITTMRDLLHSAELNTYGISDGKPYDVKEEYIFVNGQYGHIMLDLGDKSVKGLDFYHDREIQVFPKDSFHNIFNGLIDIQLYKNKYIESTEELKRLKKEFKILKKKNTKWATK